MISENTLLKFDSVFVCRLLVAHLPWTLRGGPSEMTDWVYHWRRTISVES